MHKSICSSDIMSLSESRNYLLVFWIGEESGLENSGPPTALRFTELKFGFGTDLDLGCGLGGSLTGDSLVSKG